MKIAFFELKKWEENYIKEKLKGHELVFIKNSLTKKNSGKAKDAEAIGVFIYSELSSDVLQKLKKLKFIAAMSTGFDHIDLESCKNKGIKVSNVPFYGSNTVAEHTFALILALAKKLDVAIDRTRDDNFSLEGLMGFDLKGKTLGVIGPGNIGQNVIRIGRGFQMNVLAYGIEKDLKLSKRMGFKWASLDSLFQKSDIITIHVPLNDKTRHLINRKNIEKMKKGVILINTSRGEIIDTKALRYGLDKKIISGAGLDVLEGECDIKEEKELLHGKTCDLETFIQNHLLLKDKNVIVTPHSAFFTKGALKRILDTTIENIKAFSKGRALNRVV